MMIKPRSLGITMMMVAGLGLGQDKPKEETYSHKEMVKLVEEGYRCGGLSATINLLADNEDNFPTLMALKRLYKTHHCAEIEKMLDDEEDKKELVPIDQKEEE